MPLAVDRDYRRFSGALAVKASPSRPRRRAARNPSTPTSFYCFPQLQNAQSIRWFLHGQFAAIKLRPDRTSAKSNAIDLIREVP
jgi:hypothetical protein